MLVTLETFHGSGWLNADAYCQARGGVVGSGRRDGSCVAGGFGQVMQRQAALRTENILSILVTLKTFHASGWSKACADCQARRGTVGSGRRDGACVAGGFGQAMQRQAALRTENILSMLVTLETSQASG